MSDQLNVNEMESRALETLDWAADPGNPFPEQSLARAQVYATLAVSRRLAEVLGDGSHLDKLVRQARDIAEGVQEATK